MMFSFDTFLLKGSAEHVGPPAPEIISESFSDDFSDDASGLLVYDTPQEWGKAGYEKGQYLFNLNRSSDYFIYDYYVDETLPESFILQATASYTGTMDNGYGLIFQVTESEATTTTEETVDQFYTFRISGDGFYTVEKVGENVDNLIDWTASSLINQDESAENLLTVVATGDMYDLYINGQQVDSFTDPDFTEGTFGIIAENFDSKERSRIFFDDVIVGAVE
jgi:hypothetical protein